MCVSPRDYPFNPPRKGERHGRLNRPNVQKAAQQRPWAWAWARPTDQALAPQSALGLSKYSSVMPGRKYYCTFPSI